MPPYVSIQHKILLTWGILVSDWLKIGRSDKPSDSQKLQDSGAKVVAFK